MFLVMLMEAFSARRDAQVRFLKLQNEILHKKLPGNRVIIEPNDRKRLLALGAELEHAVHDTLQIVSLKTYRAWLRDERGGKKAKKVGRPKLAKDVIDLIIRIGKENLGWGINRITGELRKLGEKVGRTSIRRILKK